MQCSGATPRQQKLSSGPRGTLPIQTVIIFLSLWVFLCTVGTFVVPLGLQLPWVAIKMSDTSASNQLIGWQHPSYYRHCHSFLCIEKVIERLHLFLSQRKCREKILHSVVSAEAWIKPQSSGTALGSNTWPKVHRQMIAGFFILLFLSVSLWVTDKQQCGVTAQPRAFTSTILLSQAHFLPSLFKAAHIHVRAKRIIVKALALP